MDTTDLVKTCGTVLVGLLLLAVLEGCRSTPANPSGQAPSRSEGEHAQVVTGTVRHIDLEGGFYGIVTDEGAKLDPVNLPEEYRKDGVRIEARVVEIRGRVSTHMWGKLVRIIEFKRLSLAKGS